MVNWLLMIRLGNFPSLRCCELATSSAEAILGSKSGLFPRLTACGLSMLGCVEPRATAPSHMLLRSASTPEHTVVPVPRGIVFQIFASHCVYWTLTCVYSRDTQYFITVRACVRCCCPPVRGVLSVRSSREPAYWAVIPVYPASGRI